MRLVRRSPRRDAVDDSDQDRNEQAVNGFLLRLTMRITTTGENFAMQVHHQPHVEAGAGFVRVIVLRLIGDSDVDEGIGSGVSIASRARMARRGSKRRAP